MEKDAYYFPHFSNARQDRKLKRVRKELGIEGYGIYFMLLETLRDEAEFKFPIADIDLLADEFCTSEQKVRTVINNYDLFKVDENEMFFSSKLIGFLQPYIDKKTQAKEAITLRWARKKIAEGRDITDLEADIIRTYNERNTSSITSCNTNKSKVNKSKVKENKEEESIENQKRKRFAPPTTEQVEEYVKEMGYAMSAHRFHDYYESNGWMVGRGKMKDWKAAVRSWESRDYSKPKQNEPEPYRPKTPQEKMAELEAKYGKVEHDN